MFSSIHSEKLVANGTKRLQTAESRHLSTIPNPTITKMSTTGENKILFPKATFVSTVYVDENRK
jgi:hypothetical protein